MNKTKPIPKNEDEWRKILTPEQYEVMRQKGTEKPFSGALLNEKRDGTYLCAGCDNPLFDSNAKFDSGTGWPSFDRPLPESIEYVSDLSGGAEQTEVKCANCGSHLGHVFDDGPTETSKRYCLNSVCLTFKPK